jgi:serine/threonine-protein kinase
MDATRPGLSLPERYAVMHHIANGGMASVYAARDTRLDRVVAVKVLAPAYAADADARRRFTREARAAARLSMHPHIVSVYDAGEHDGTAFIVMALYPGGTVGQRLRQGPVAQDLALRWLEQAGSALDHAHAQGVVHRDVKPGNLLLDEHDRLAVGDFGIATAAWEASVTQAGMVLGTMAYLSPEQRAGQRATAASDRYALAVVAHELLAGRRPSADPAAGAAPLAPEVAAVIDAGMAEDPGRRPGSCGELVDRLEIAVDDAGGDATAVTQVLPAPLPEPTPRPRPRPAAAAVPVAAAGAALPHADDEPVTQARTPRPPRAAAPLPPTGGDRGGPPVRAGGPPGDGRGGRGWKALAALAALALTIGVVAALVSGLGSGGDAERTARTPTTATDGAGTTAEEPAASTEKPASTATEEAAPPATAEEPAPEPEPEPEPAPEPEPEGQGNGNAGGGGNGGEGNRNQGGGTGGQGNGNQGGGNGGGGAQLTTAQAAALNDQGFAKTRAGNPAGAVPDLRRAVDGLCRNESDIRCAYALFNLGRALRLSGNPAEAVPVLERRLQVNDTNQPGVVRAELARARREAGQG